VTFYRKSGYDAGIVRLKLKALFLKQWPELTIHALAIAPLSFVDTEGLDILEVSIATPNLTRAKGSFEVHFGKGGRVEKRLFFRYEMEATLPVLKANRNIVSGTIISAQNCEIVPVSLDQIRGVPMATGALGKVEAKSYIRPGAVVMASQGGPIPDIKRGDTVTARIKTEGVKLDFRVTAMDGGMSGERITVKDSRGREYQAVITGPGEVAIP